MLDRKVTQVKVIFACIVILFIGAIVFAVSEHAARSLTFAISQELQYVKYRWEFNRGTSSMLAGAYGFMTNPLSATEHTATANASASAIPVLVYHRIPKESDGANVPLATFKSHLSTLQSEGWNTITLEAFSSFLKEGQRLPEKSFLLTFDDGARASYYPVDPLLRVFGYNAVAFVIPQYSLRSKTTYYVSQDDLENMLASGRWEIGSHGFESHTHIPVNSLGDEAPYLGNKVWLDDTQTLESTRAYTARITKDLRQSKSALVEALDITVTAIAYPFGDFGQRSRNYTQAEEVVRAQTASVYTLAFAQIDTETTSAVAPLSPLDDALLINRIRVDPTWSGKELIEKMEGIVNASSFPYRK